MQHQNFIVKRSASGCKKQLPQEYSTISKEDTLILRMRKVSNMNRRSNLNESPLDEMKSIYGAKQQLSSKNSSLKSHMAFIENSC
jgi:hypothetical protein